MRFMTRSSVDLPQPEGPMKAVTFGYSGRVIVFERLVVAVKEVEIPH